MFRSSLPLTLFVLAVATASAAAQSTTRSSVSSLAAEADLASSAPSISANGQFIAFRSEASNLVSGDTNGVADVFLHDRLAGTTIRVSVTSAGAEATGASTAPVITANARFISFESAADDLIPNDTNGASDVFIRDLVTGITARASVSSGNQEGNGASTHPTVSADGRYVCFESVADNLVSGDANGARDVFMRDMLNGTTRRVSVDGSGAEGNDVSSEPHISADGRFVVFRSAATNLVPLDTNLKLDVFVYDVMLGEISLVSGGLSGAQSNGDAQQPSISANGRFVAFESDADNLVVGDGNLAADVFVHDRLSGVTERESVESGGLEGNMGSHVPEIALSGRYVTFQSFATNLVLLDTNGVVDVFCRDRLLGTTTRVSVDTPGTEGNAASGNPSISGTCRYVAFESDADNLIVGDLNSVGDVFVRDRGASVALSVDTIVLSCEVFLTAGAHTRLVWCNAPPSTPWWLLYSQNNNGTSFNAHPFGVGPGVNVLVTGTNNAAGSGAFYSPPLPLGLSGRTIYLEVASRLGSDFYESNTIERFVQ